jgi:hypothetical protein
MLAAPSHPECDDMALFEMTPTGLSPIAPRTFTQLGLLERSDIQRAVRSHIAAITPGVKTMVLAEEFGDWVGANRRIDLLCLDEEARLVVVELKRDDGASMELQALRYAAMISTMRFDQAVEAHRKYLNSIGITGDPEQMIREFLDVEEGPIALSETVRIVLAASDFRQDITTTVLWLNRQGLDIRCVQMRPHSVDQRILLDIQQVIPLPEAEQYQVAVREKSLEQAAAKSNTRDWTRYDLTIGQTTLTNLPKRRLIYEVVAEAIKRGVSPSAVSAAVPWKENSMFVSVYGAADESAFSNAFPEGALHRYYANENDLFRVGDRTYAFTTQWGNRTLEAVGNLLSVMPAGTQIEHSPTTPVVNEVSYGDYVLRQRENGTIEVEHEGALVQPALPTLRELAQNLNLSLLNGRGNEQNTRQLGAQVMKAIATL